MSNILKLFLEISTISAAMILVVMALRAILAKRMNPGIIAVLWTVVLIRLCIPFNIESPIHIAEIFPEPPTTVEQTSESAYDTAAETTISASPMRDNTAAYPQPYTMPEIPETLGTQTTTAAETIQPTIFAQLGAWFSSLSVWSILSAVWMIGALALLLITLAQAVAFKRRLNKCKRVTDGYIVSMLNQHKKSLGIKRNITLLECNQIPTPAVFGFFKPYILLPGAITAEMNVGTISCILLHELCHIKRRDILKSYVWLIAKAAHWFNPLVWIAYRMAKDDNELCCDQMVLSQLADDKYEYTQSLVDVLKISKRKAGFAVTVSLYEKKSKLVERVMRMLKPEKRSKSAVVLSLVLAVIMAIACFTTACQPVTNTEEPVEVSTTDEQPAVEPISTPAPQVTSEAPEEEVKEPLAKYSVTDHWTEIVEKEDSVIKLNIDADIVTPETETFNTYEVNPPGHISQEMADRLVEVLFGDTPVYKRQEPTKAELQKELDDYLSIYQSMMDGTFDFSHYLNEQKAIESIETHIERLEEDIKDAPETVESMPLDTTLESDDFDGGWFSGVADLGREEQATITVHNINDSYCNSASVRFLNEGYYWDREREPFQLPIGNLTITEEQAIEKAEQFFEQMGLSDYQLFESYIAQRAIRFIADTNEYAHVLRYTRVIDGIIVSPTGHVPYLESMDHYAEDFTITIDDDGIREIDWKHIFNLGESVAEKQQLLPMDQIQDIIAEEMFVEEKIIDTYERDMDIPGFKTIEYIYNIDQMRLEYVKIPFGDDDVRLTPVWNIFGSVDWRYSKKENGERVEDVFDDDESYQVFTVNAIDGSMVDKKYWANGKFY